MKIITDTISIEKLKEMATNTFGDMVKGVVDVEHEILALEAELHSDLETLLLEKNSKQNNLWGINLYPDLPFDDFIEFDSMINIRPSQKNYTRGVESIKIQKKIIKIVQDKVQK